MSVMIIFILLLGVIAFRVLCYTRLYKCSFVEKAFKWTSSLSINIILEKRLQEQFPNDVLDGRQVEERSAI